jgi:hypothetical protein
MSWGKENDNGGKKVMTRGRRSKIIDGQKNNLIANRGLKSKVHGHILLEECEGRIVFLSFDLQHIPNISE